MEKLKAFFETPVGKVVKTAVPLLLVLFIGFMAGRGFKPAPDIKIVEKEVIKTVEVVKTVEVEKKSDTTKLDSEADKHVHKEHTEEIKIDGTKSIKDTVDINDTKTIHVVDIQYVDRTVTVEKQVVVEKKVEVTKIVKTALPDWTVAAKVGVSVTNLFNPTLGSPVVVGVEVDRRILGPFKAGVWVNTVTTFNQWQTGISLLGEF